ncbi:gliding motility-associated ABC transporter ATP-binding subunit GldA [soil metagenome]
MSIEVAEITKFYGQQKAVNAISFKINKGEIVGFLGPNGAGKSTTLKIITGFIQADEGNAFVSNINVKEQPQLCKKKIGYLPEANPLYYEMYVREFLDFICGVHSIQNRTQRIEEIISLTGLTPESNKKIGQLSKGYKQRVGLAAALIHDPEILILDEPTSGLDPNQIIEIRELIKKLAANKTVLFSSHILQEVEAICDRVIIINNGNIVADDQLNNLKSSATSSSFVYVEFDQPADINNLSQLEFVTDAHAVNVTTFKLHTQHPDEVKKQLLRYSLQQQLNVVSLQSKKDSLEDIFRSLTNQQ